MLEEKNLLEILFKYKAKILNSTADEAAVMLILLTSNDEEPLQVVITKRAETLPTYAGHFSFPGGMRDTTDESLYATAVRETQEELNLLPEDYQYVVQLDDFTDRYNNLVRPFVTIMKKEDFNKKYQISLEEISEIYFFSLSKLPLIKDNPHLHGITRRRPSYSFSENNIFIWGLTAAILVHFYNIVTGKNLPLGKKVEL